MGSHRRRYHDRPVNSVTLISAVCLVLFVVIAFLSFLALPLVDHPSFPNPPPLRRRPSFLLKNPVEIQKNVILATSFDVPCGGGVAENDLWGSKMAKYFYGCSNASSNFKKAEEVTQPDRYLMIATSGGLNQQRTGVRYKLQINRFLFDKSSIVWLMCQNKDFVAAILLVIDKITDAVVAARILNATLIVPTLDQKSFWKDASNFTDIFDVNWFISSLSKDVKIIKQLPEKAGEPVRTPHRMRVPRKCTAKCYQNRVLPALLKKHVVQLTKFDYRLSNKLATNLQKLRCRVNYHALRFTDQILEMGEMLIQRMKAEGKRFIALHLRFEPDMLAFSGCDYGGGDKERNELGAIRKRWKSLHANNPDKVRRHGKCPLTPEEVGLMLRALGFGKDMHIYVASGDVHGGEETLAPLKALFPNFHSKETLASKEELAPFSSFSSRMAALDFIVCDGSDVFVTNNNGNMARMLAGRRRYFGHKRTIRPNAKKLYLLFLNRTQMTFDMFASKVRTFQQGFMGEPNEMSPGSGEFHENPCNCICEKSASSGSEIITKVGNKNVNDNSSTDGEEELDWRELDYGENVPLGKSLPNRTESEYDLFIRSEEPELEEILSD